MRICNGIPGVWQSRVAALDAISRALQPRCASGRVKVVFYTPKADKAPLKRGKRKMVRAGKRTA